MKESKFSTFLIGACILIFFAGMAVKRTDNKFNQGQAIVIKNGDIPAVISRVPAWVILTGYQIKYFDKSGALRTEQLSERELESLIKNPE